MSASFTKQPKQARKISFIFIYQWAIKRRASCFDFASIKRLNLSCIDKMEKSILRKVTPLILLAFMLSSFNASAGLMFEFVLEEPVVSSDASLPNAPVVGDTFGFSFLDSADFSDGVDWSDFDSVFFNTQELGFHSLTLAQDRLFGFAFNFDSFFRVFEDAGQMFMEVTIGDTGLNDFINFTNTSDTFQIQFGQTVGGSGNTPLTFESSGGFEAVSSPNGPTVFSSAAIVDVNAPSTLFLFAAALIAMVGRFGKGQK